MQSGRLLHINPLPHCLLGKHDPPQSTSVSFPFFTPSVQVGTTINKAEILNITNPYILTLTNISRADAANAVWPIIAHRSITTLFTRQT
jgi:hypothetical protein